MSSAPTPAPAAGTATEMPALAAGGVASPLRSLHTSSLPLILRQLGMSLLVTTYQAGRLVIARAQPDGVLNTHFFGFSRPMGLAVDRQRLYLGTQNTVDEFRNVPAVCPRLTPPEAHDAAYVWRNTHVTGSIDIHEMGLGADGRLYFINTAFSCVCVLDAEHSFVPVWRPSFISRFVPEDRCHLNGLGMVAGQPRWLTALGEYDSPQGWRANKRDGGIVLDMRAPPGQQVVLRGLCMPHSPRWYRECLWFLESGRGALVQVGAQGERRTVAQVPGFARGLSFAGPLAFIGLSQLRESNAFTDIPLTEDQSPRSSGVWVVNIDTGETVALLKFEDAVQEIFAVELLPANFPELIGLDNPLIQSTFVIPDAALQEVQ